MIGQLQQSELRREADAVNRRRGGEPEATTGSSPGAYNGNGTTTGKSTGNKLTRHQQESASGHDCGQTLAWRHRLPEIDRSQTSDSATCRVSARFPSLAPTIMNNIWRKDPKIEPGRLLTVRT
jgi:hypothetical protein